MLEELHSEQSEILRMLEVLRRKREETKRLYEAEEQKQRELLQKQEAEVALVPERELKVCEESLTENFKEMAEWKLEVCDEARTGNFKKEAQREAEVCLENGTLEPEVAKDEVEEINIDPTVERSEVSSRVPRSDVPNENETSSDAIVAENREIAVSLRGTFEEDNKKCYNWKKRRRKVKVSRRCRVSTGTKPENTRKCED